MSTYVFNSSIGEEMPDSLPRFDSKEMVDLEEWIEITENIDERVPWEVPLHRWVRRMENIIVQYLDDDVDTSKIESYLDEHLFDRTWMERFVTGSNVSAVNAGKAVWALVRAVKTGDERFVKKYYRASHRTEKYISRAFTKRGVPYEGILYGMFGLQPVAILSHLQNECGLWEVGYNIRLRRFAPYIRMSAVGRMDFHAHQDSKPEEFDASFLWYLRSKGDGHAGQALALLSDRIQRREYYNDIYGGGEPPKLENPFYKEITFKDEEIEQVIIKRKRPNRFYIVDGNRGFGRNSLHLGVKAGSTSIWIDGEWKQRSPGYVNPTANAKEYNPSVFNSPASLLEEAEVTIEEDGIKTQGRGWDKYCPVV